MRPHETSGQLADCEARAPSTRSLPSRPRLRVAQPGFRAERGFPDGK